MTNAIPTTTTSYFNPTLGFWTRRRSFTSRRHLLGAIETYERLGLNYRIERNGQQINIDEIEVKS